MKKSKYNKILVALITGLFFILGFSSLAYAEGGSHILSGKILPQNTDLRPAAYQMWLSTNPAVTISGACTYSITKWTNYNSNLQTWDNTWKNSDVIIVKVEKENAVESGAGYYGNTSITLNDATTTQYFPDINWNPLAPIPQPTVNDAGNNGDADISWSAATGTHIAGYNIYRATEADPTNFVKINKIPVTTGTSYIDNATNSNPAPIPGTKYYYAVKIIFGSEAKQIESTYRSLKSILFPYPLPANAAPADPINLKQSIAWGVLTNINQPIFTFDITDPDSANVKFRVQVATANTFAADKIVLDYTSPNPVPKGTINYTVSPALADNINGYYWRVKAISDAGAENQNWSVANSGNVAFKLDTVAPQITSTIPADGAKQQPLNTSSILVTFSEALNTASYQNINNYTISGGHKIKSPITGSIINGKQVVTLPLDPTTPFSFSETVTVTVLGVTDNAGNPIIANPQVPNPWTFYIVDNTPPAVSNVKASQDALGKVNISYDLADAEQVTVNVSFQYWDGSSWKECATTLLEGNVKPGAGKTGVWTAKTDWPGQYTATTKIQVTANDGQAKNNLGLAESLAYTLDTKNPDVACLLPQNNDPDAVITPTLQSTIDQNEKSTPVQYYFQLAEENGFHTGLQESSWQSSPSWTPLAALKNQQDYYWHVKAKDAVGNESSYSLNFKFTTVAPPNTPPTVDSLVQYTQDAPPVLIDAGKYTSKDKIDLIFHAADADGNPLTYQFRWKKVSEQWLDNMWQNANTVNITGSAIKYVNDLPDGDYEWQAKASDGIAAVIVDFNNNSGAADFKVDATAPQVAGTDPANDPAGQNPQDDQLDTVTFDINEPNLNVKYENPDQPQGIVVSDYYSVKGDKGGDYTSKITWINYYNINNNSATRVLLYAFDVPKDIHIPFGFQYGETITVTVKPGAVTDKAGNVLVGNQPEPDKSYQWSFKVEEMPPAEVTNAYQNSVAKEKYVYIDGGTGDNGTLNLEGNYLGTDLGNGQMASLANNVQIKDSKGTIHTVQDLRPAQNITGIYYWQKQGNEAPAVQLSIPSKGTEGANILAGPAAVRVTYNSQTKGFYNDVLNKDALKILPKIKAPVSNPVSESTFDLPGAGFTSDNGNAMVYFGNNPGANGTIKNAETISVAAPSVAQQTKFQTYIELTIGGNIYKSNTIELTVNPKPLPEVTNAYQNSVAKEKYVYIDGGTGDNGTLNLEGNYLGTDLGNGQMASLANNVQIKDSKGTIHTVQDLRPAQNITGIYYWQKQGNEAPAVQLSIPSKGTEGANILAGPAAVRVTYNSQTKGFYNDVLNKDALKILPKIKAPVSNPVSESTFNLPGAGFTSDDGKAMVYFGNNPVATGTITNAETISVQAPKVSQDTKYAVKVVLNINGIQYESNTIDVTVKFITPTISGILWEGKGEAQGPYAGQTITITGNNFFAYDKANSKIEIGGIPTKPTQWNVKMANEDLYQIVVAIPSGAAGLDKIVKITNKSGDQNDDSTKLTIDPAKVYIDDFEGGAVGNLANLASQYGAVSGGGAAIPTYSFENMFDINGKPSKAIQIHYAGSSDPAANGAVYAILANSELDISGQNIIDIGTMFTVRTEGISEPGNYKIYLEFKEADGERWKSKNPVDLSDSLNKWKAVSLPISEFIYSPYQDAPKVDGKPNGKITQYSIVFTGKGAAQADEYVFFDSLTAQKVAIPETKISNVSIKRDADTKDASVTLSWTTDQLNAKVDIYTKAGDFSVNKADWTLAPDFANITANGASGTKTDANQVGQGTAKYYKVMPAGKALTDADLKTDVVGKFDWHVDAGKFSLVSLPIIPSSTALDSVIGNQVSTGWDPSTAGAIYGDNNGSWNIAWKDQASGNWLDTSWQPVSLIIEPDKAYWIFDTATRDITIVGKASPTVKSIPIKVGWNFVGSAYSMSTAVASSGLGSCTAGWDPSTSGALYSDNAGSWDIAWKDQSSGNWLNVSFVPSALKLEPGKGYWFYEPTTPFTWTYPAPY